MQKLKTNQLNRLSLVDFKKAKKRPIVLVLDNIRSLNNVGSAFRTSDAFAIEAIYLCGSTGKPPHKEIRKTAIGASESVAWKYFETTEKAIQLLQENNFEILAIEQTNESVELQKFEIQATKKYALVFGNEVDGVSDVVLSLCKNAIEIPQFGTKHSFNISVSVGIVLWQFINNE